VPVGAGLSSSAALECAAALAASEMGGAGINVDQLARLAQRAENDYVGVPCGLMDQMASAACRAGNLLFFDVRASSVEQVPFDPAAEGLRVLIIDTRVKHSLTDGEYAKRRASCEQAAAELGVESLRSLGPEDLPVMANTLSSELLYRRARHVVTENDRVARCVALLRIGGMKDIGALLTASHVSLRDDYEVSDPALDIAVDTALAHGALGARMTGGGFGGSAIALLPAERLDEIGDSVKAAFSTAGLDAPVLRPAVPSGGAARDS
jgi:galactokinase